MAWLRETSTLQRTAVALFLFGCHNRDQTAELLGLSPEVMSALLGNGLLDVWAGETTTPAHTDHGAVVG